MNILVTFLKLIMIINSMATARVSKYFFSKELILITLGTVIFLSACLLNTRISKPDLNLSKQDTAININQNFLLFTNAGNKRLFTDLLWVQTLIESDIEHYKKKDLNNWLFHRFNTISVLDPKFYENYAYGGQFLAIVKDDLEGANIIYDKGLQFYPDDYLLNYNAGFLNYYEMDNYAKGLSQLEKISNHPRSPVFLQSIINKLRVSTGIELQEVFKLVHHNYETTKDEALKHRLLKDLYSIKAEIDLKCLNNSIAECDNKDLDGTPYIKKGSYYYSPKPFLQYRINKRSEDDRTPEQKRIDFIK